MRRFVLFVPYLPTLIPLVGTMKSVSTTTVRAMWAMNMSMPNGLVSMSTSPAQAMLPNMKMSKGILDWWIALNPTTTRFRSC